MIQDEGARPDGRMVVLEHKCEFHRRNPNTGYAGCTCSRSFVFQPIEDDVDGAIEEAKRWEKMRDSG